ncbi:CarD family transcriptional regulator [Vineibacter terrae]|uniref:CarD family transcriptional regulator n=1 Tax=Vineibacter terrae TaxID=2586908 RepID=UPI002E381423|nr:CarD family transcriptional regulator [Vineibacter terrae]HEX2885711.1 CarD family transcriptional regulator [Vineibacter terrae]
MTIMKAGRWRSIIEPPRYLASPGSDKMDITASSMPNPSASTAPATAPTGEPPTTNPAFAKGDLVVYPAHGVGRVADIETRHIAGSTLDLVVISFEQARLTLRVPTAKAQASGLRRLSSRKIMDNALKTLKGRSRVRRAMWNRRAQEYGLKINSGDPVSIAEVLRDLHANVGDPDRSYSERQIYEAALDRLARELAAVEHTDKDAATRKLTHFLDAPSK